MSQSPRIPEPLASDYVLLACYVVLFLIGAPVNLAAFAKLHEKYLGSDEEGAGAVEEAAKRKRQKSRNSGLRMLKVHLNLADLLILFVYTSGKICWLLTYSWRGGALLCKFMKIVNSAVFQLSSNVIVCIGIDRALIIIYKRNRSRAFKIIRISVWVFWILAISINIPHYFFWTTVSPRPGVAWHQCVTVWHARRHQLHNFNFTTIKEPLISEDLYTLLNLLGVFWLPFVLLILLYLFVIFNLQKIAQRHKPFELENSALLKKAAKISVDTKIYKHSSIVEAQKRKDLLITDDEPKKCAKGLDENAILPGKAGRRSSSTTTTTSKSATALTLSAEIRVVKRKTVRTSFLLVTAYLLCWLPYNTIAMWHFLDPASFKTYENVFRFLYTLIVLNSVVNPFLYGMIDINRIARRFWLIILNFCHIK